MEKNQQQQTPEKYKFQIESIPYRRNRLPNATTKNCFGLSMGLNR